MIEEKERAKINKQSTIQMNFEDNFRNVERQEIKKDPAVESSEAYLEQLIETPAEETWVQAIEKIPENKPVDYQMENNPEESKEVLIDDFIEQK